MVLVLLFLGLLIINIFLVLILICSTLKIEVDNVKIKKLEMQNLEKNYKIYIKLYLFNKIPLFRILLNKQRINKIIAKDNILFKKNTINEINYMEIMKMLSPQIESLNLNMKIGTGNAIFTSALVFIISTALSLSFPHIVIQKNKSRIKYEITPIYIGKNLFSIHLQGIICIKMVHIINIIYIYLQKRRGVKDERTSNRRSYANSYE